MNKLKTFLKLFYAHRFFNDFVLLYPVYMLLFESKGLTVFDMSLLLTIWSVTAVLFEVPTGVLADRISRKLIIITGTSFKLICFVLWLFAEEFFLFAAGFVFWGLQEAFCSGSTEALLYDTLKKHGCETDYEKYSGRSGFYAGAGVTASMLFGGYVASLGFHAVTIISIISVATAIAAAFGLEETYKPQDPQPAEPNYVSTLKGGLLQIKTNKTVLILLLFNAFVIIIPGVLEEYDQLYVEHIGLSLGYIGIWGAVRTGVESLGSRFAYKFGTMLDSISRISIFALAGSLLLFVSVFIFSVFLLPVYALFYFINSVCYVLSESAVQRNISSENRATILSVNSLLYNLTGVAYNFGFALAAQYSGIRIGFLVMASYTALASLSFFLIFKSSRIKQIK